MLRKNKVELPIEVISIKDEGYHLFVEVHVNEQPIRLLLDTGASRTVFDMDVIQRVCADVELEENEDKATGLGSSQVENFIVILNSLVLGEIELTEYQTGVLNLSHVNVSYGNMGFSTIGGVLGSDILMKFNAIIDYKKRKLFLEKKD